MVSTQDILDFEKGQWEFESDYEDQLIKEELEHMERWGLRETPQGVTHFYPSSLWMCYLKQFFQRKEPRHKKLSSLKILDFGELFHTYFVARRLRKKYGKLVHQEERGITHTVEPGEIYIRGKIDNLIMLRKPKSIVLIPIEVKTTGRGMKYLKAPKLEHILQLMVYIVNLGAKGGYLVYVERSGFSDDDDNGDPIGISKTFYVPFDIELFTQLEYRARTMHEWIIADKVPYPEAKQSKSKKKQCKYCEYKIECKKLVANWEKFNETPMKWENLQELIKNV